MKKIQFRFYNEILERNEVEPMWAKAVDEEKGIYQLRNIPYFVKGFAADDTVEAREEDGMLTVTRLLEPSGNSTLNIVILRGREKDRVMQELKNLGGEWEEREKPVNGFYAVNVPKQVPFRPIKDLLTRERRLGILDYREACVLHLS